MLFFYTLTCFLVASVDMFSKSDPFLIFYRRIRDAKYGPVHPIYITEVLINKSDPKWKEIVVPLHHWCNGDLSAEIIVDCYDYDRRSLLSTTAKKRYIGSFAALTTDLLKSDNTFKLRKNVGLDKGDKVTKNFFLQFAYF